MPVDGSTVHVAPCRATGPTRADDSCVQATKDPVGSADAVGSEDGAVVASPVEVGWDPTAEADGCGVVDGVGARGETGPDTSANATPMTTSSVTRARTRRARADMPAS